MLFNSLIFPLFLAIVLTLHWGLRGHTHRTVLLLAASYAFYGWWDYRFLALILLSSLVDYQCGIRIENAKTLRHRRQLLYTSLVVNLGVLACFKYFGFFLENLVQLLSRLGIHPDWPTLNIILPVGISFYTFQTLSYTIDVYRGKIHACQKPLTFFLFVAFFPQLVAGPIEKARRLLPQLSTFRRFDRQQAVLGVRFMLLGYLLKSVVADNMAPIVNEVYGNPDDFSAISLLFATYCFAFQIYGDFAGYSYIAIGVAAMFGVRLATNFERPYLSQSVREFWKRWHISLSSWFAEYFYVHLLGGNRAARSRRIANVFATFVVSGIWHGANWTFVLWGLLNGAMYFVGRPFRSTGRVRSLLNAALCFHLVCLGWIFFRASSVGQGLTIAGSILSNEEGQSIPGNTLLMLSVAMLSVLLLERYQSQGTIVELPPSKWVRLCVYTMALLIFFFLGNFDRQPFIYFQF